MRAEDQLPLFSQLGFLLYDGQGKGAVGGQPGAEVKVDPEGLSRMTVHDVNIWRLNRSDEPKRCCGAFSDLARLHFSSFEAFHGSALTRHGEFQEPPGDAPVSSVVRWW